MESIIKPADERAVDRGPQEAFTPDQFADYMGWGRGRVYRMLHSGALPSRLVGRRRYLTRSDLVAAGWLSR